MVDKKTDTAAPLAATTETGDSVGDFKFLALIGRGISANVVLAKTKSKQLYAIKILRKDLVIGNDEVGNLRTEKEVFLQASGSKHPFLLSCHSCFQTETRLCFVMDYMIGGDLFVCLQRNGKFKHEQARFYSAEICLALKYLHERKILHRNLKLENVLLGIDGHIKLAGYGVCKEGVGYGSTTRTFCGSLNFMAPEVLLDKSYGLGVDWWAFGVVLFQMIFAQEPFVGEDQDEVYDDILECDPRYPTDQAQDDAAVSLMRNLLKHEPRLGSGVAGAQEIMNHAFFAGLNWDDVYNKRMQAPFLPAVEHEGDTSHFDKEVSSSPLVLLPNHLEITEAMQEEFRGFEYSTDGF